MEGFWEYTDIAQYIGYSLELIGFYLAYLETFREQKAKRLEQWIDEKSIKYQNKRTRLFKRELFSSGRVKRTKLNSYLVKGSGILILGASCALSFWLFWYTRTSPELYYRYVLMFLSIMGAGFSIWLLDYNIRYLLAVGTGDIIQLFDDWTGGHAIGGFGIFIATIGIVLSSYQVLGQFIEDFL